MIFVERRRKSIIDWNMKYLYPVPFTKNYYSKNTKYINNNNNNNNNEIIIIIIIINNYIPYYDAIKKNDTKQTFTVWSVRIQENKYQRKLVFEHFSRSVLHTSDLTQKTISKPYQVDNNSWLWFLHYINHINAVSIDFFVIPLIYFPEI